MEQTTVIVREPRFEDKNFILNSWLLNNYYSNPDCRNTDKDQYMLEYGQHIKELMFNPDTVLIITALEESPNMVIGYQIYKGPTLFWAYVKGGWRADIDYRRRGIFNLMFNGRGIDSIIGTTRASLGIARKKGLKVIFANRGDT